MSAVVISPHLDDAVLSLGQFLAGYPSPLVVTVLAGSPAGGADLLTPYDEQCGFRSAAGAMETRRGEDHAALHHLGARVAQLSLLDSQYRGGTPEAVEVIRHAVVTTLMGEASARGIDLVLVPAGIVHPDHQAVAAACTGLPADLLPSATDGRPVLHVYEELPMRVVDPEAAAEAMAAWDASGWDREGLRFVGSGPLPVKAAAVSCYQSQWGALAGLSPHAPFCPERVWEVRCPQG